MNEMENDAGPTVHLRLGKTLDARIKAIVERLPGVVGGVKATKQTVIRSVLKGERTLAQYEELVGLRATAEAKR